MKKKQKKKQDIDVSGNQKHDSKMNAYVAPYLLGV